jgi:hypothetical protein
MNQLKLRIDSCGPGCYLVRGLLDTPENRDLLPDLILREYGAEITHIESRYWRVVPAPPGDDEFPCYIYPAKGPGRGAFFGMWVETKTLGKNN